MAVKIQNNPTNSPSTSIIDDINNKDSSPSLNIDPVSLTALDKMTEMSAGTELIDELNKKLNHEHEELIEQSTSSDHQTNNESHRDTASLSNQSILKSINKPWTTDTILELLEAFLNWTPSPLISLSEDLKQLSKIYHTLLEAILSNTEGSVQQSQLNQLEDLLSISLQKFTDVHVKSLSAFFQKFDSGNAQAILRNTIFQSVTGHTLSLKEAQQFWSPKAKPAGLLTLSKTPGGSPNLKSPSNMVTQQKTVVQQNTALQRGVTTQQNPVTQRGLTAQQNPVTPKGSTAQQNPVTPKGSTAQQNPMSPKGSAAQQNSMIRHDTDLQSAAIVKHGTIYKSAGSGQIRTSQTYLQRMSEEDLHAATVTAAGNKGDKSKMLSPTAATVNFEQRLIGKSEYKLYTAGDIAKTEPFIKHMTTHGNLLNNQQITADNEEILGVLSALTSIKADVFCNSVNISKPMIATVKTSVEKMVDYYISNQKKKQDMPASFYSSSIRPSTQLNKKDVYKIYYYIMNQYQTHKNPDKAVSNGLLLALQTFNSKKAALLDSEVLTPNNQSGFFFKPAENERAANEWRDGIQLLKDNWKEFLKTIRQDHKKSYNLQLKGFKDSSNLELMAQSPWGAATKPPVIPIKLFSKNTILVLTVLGILVLSILAYFLT